MKIHPSRIKVTSVLFLSSSHYQSYTKYLCSEEAISILLCLDAYHHSSCYSNSSAAISVRYNIAISDTEECDGNEPHCVQQVRVLLVMVPVKKEN